MGYLDGSTITVDAILTGEGRKKLANGAGLGITKFSLSDDGVDYKLWNVHHGSGSAYYGEAIDNLPNLEAITDSHIGMRYHLMTMDRDRVFLPNLSITPSEGITIERQGAEGMKPIDVTTFNYGNELYEYTIFDASAISVNAATRDVGSSTHNFHTRQEVAAPMIAGPVQRLEVTALPLDHKVTTIIEIYGKNSGAVGFVSVTALANIRELPRDPHVTK